MNTYKNIWAMIQLYTAMLIGAVHAVWLKKHNKPVRLDQLVKLALLKAITHDLTTFWKSPEGSELNVPAIERSADSWNASWVQALQAAGSAENSLVGASIKLADYLADYSTHKLVTYGELQYNLNSVVRRCTLANKAEFDAMGVDMRVARLPHVLFLAYVEHLKQSRDFFWAHGVLKQVSSAAKSVEYHLYLSPKQRGTTVVGL